jgi:hypothetical protein
MSGDAKFDSTRKYRYSLIRNWAYDFQPAEPVLFIGLNPSTANEHYLDPTVRKCCVFAKKWGYMSLLMGNIYSYRATKPKDLFKSENPISPDDDPSQNDKALINMHRDAHITIACWGALADPKRIEDVTKNLWFKPLYCLGINKNGSPKHPLYIPYETKPVLYK